MKGRNYENGFLFFVISGMALTQPFKISLAFPIHRRDAPWNVRRSMDSDVISDTTQHISHTPTLPVGILDQNDSYLVVNKPPAVVCHHSPWAGLRQGEIPMLQRIREQVQRRVNLVHRLDRGASGCLLCTYADAPEATAVLSDALQTNSTKTYMALVRGEGIVNGTDLKQRGWFRVERPIRDERGREREAATWLRFVAGQDNGAGTLDRAGRRWSWRDRKPAGGTKFGSI
jgi:23S rRNA-/tRNA-specific pseudouridylate synthase